MSEDRKVEDDLRRLKVKVKKKVKGLWRSSDKLEIPTADNEGPSEQSTPDSQQLATGSLQGGQPQLTADSVTPGVAPHQQDALSAKAEVTDTAGWDKIWVEAYKMVKEDPKKASLLAKFELFLENRGQTVEPATNDDASTAVDSFTRLKTIQKIAEEQLTKFCSDTPTPILAIRK
ncbi:uncharacterized protein FIESC28_11208 [Fusarium coffeatum]|uniref:Uncharacterized protein n=1 Tax=Fusarium coffeatum TaxID=231269 RepID=A0A366QQ23_9HYPO|nr:uncharacterized protein FIESC28_11208 [Fusarium coffeatum]RBR06030.1 hypothetical protein FIESC28_11208 [Fusarium coffeatum]